MLISVAYQPGCTLAHSQSHSGCAPQTNFTEYVKAHGGTVIRTRFPTRKLPSAITSREPVTTCSVEVHGIPFQCTVNVSVWSLSPANGPYPPGGSIDEMNPAIEGKETGLTLLYPPTAAFTRLMIVLTMLPGLIPVAS